MCELSRFGTLIGGNHVFARMSGYSAAELESGTLHWRDLTPPEWVAQSEAQMAGSPKPVGSGRMKRNI